MPDEIGTWQWSSACSDAGNDGLHQKSGQFTCSEPDEMSVFEQHGRLRLSPDQRYLMHDDGTPFFWLGDTAWNGPLLSTADEWKHYITQRKRQTFTAVQWVATQWISAPDGDLNGELAYNGHEHIQVNPAFFQRLDAKIVALNRAGLLSVPVMLWAAHWSKPQVNARNPGFTLPEDQAIKLARYMVARWSAYHTVWLLPGDGDYRGERADRWRRIGRAVFHDAPDTLVSLHPGGMQWCMDEFRDEPWLNIAGYQSGHGDDDAAFRWLNAGPPAQDWHKQRPRPLINLEPPYEGHIAFQSRRLHDDHSARRGLYWSLLNAPTAGVTYGGHGIWGWDDGSAPPVGHPRTGTPKPWQEALHLPAAEQLRHLSQLFASLNWWELCPAPEVLAVQPGDAQPRRFIAASRAGNTLLLYLPENDQVEINASAFLAEVPATWFNPRTGELYPVQYQVDSSIYRLNSPGAGDWLLVIGATLSS